MKLCVLYELRNVLRKNFVRILKECTLIKELSKGVSVPTAVHTPCEVETISVSFTLKFHKAVVCLFCVGFFFLGGGRRHVFMTSYCPMKFKLCMIVACVDTVMSIMHSTYLRNIILLIDMFPASTKP